MFLFRARGLFLCAVLIVVFTASGLTQNMPATAAGTPQTNASTPASSSPAFEAALNDYWQYTLKAHPEVATIYGDNRYNDQISDWSPQFFKSDIEKKRQFLARFEAISASGLSQQQQLTKSLAERKLQEDIEEAQFKPWEIVENQMYGPHLNYAAMQHTMPFKTAKDYENYIARLHKLPRAFDQVEEDMRLGISDKIVQPKYLLEKVAEQAQGIGSKQGDASPFAAPLKKMPADISQQDQTRLRNELVAVINNEVDPAYLKLAKFVRDECVPKGRTEFGIWSVPNGDARYRFYVHKITTTKMTPEEVHEIGLREVQKDEQEMLAIAQKLGYKDLKSFSEHVKTDPQLYAKSREQILDLYRQYIAGMTPELPKLFGRLPKAQVIVTAFEPYEEASAPGADYQTGTPDGSRPGRIRVNTGDFTHRTLTTIESTAYHEGVPGHHLQLSIAQEMPGLPPFRQHLSYTAFIEGWGLYAEQLGKDVGFYKDPYSDYGRLESDMLRAIRLVVDTGVHYKHWTRQEMVDFFHQHSTVDEPSVQAEVDRYIAWPAQALGYKVGQLRILQLRDRARQALGNKFDIRAFHDDVIDSGSLPLDVLEERVDAWIAEQKGTAPQK
jgi:uncharacterized protein (DUF885 family)